MKRILLIISVFSLTMFSACKKDTSNSNDNKTTEQQTPNEWTSVPCSAQLSDNYFEMKNTSTQGYSKFSVSTTEDLLTNLDNFTLMGNHNATTVKLLISMNYFITAAVDGKYLVDLVSWQKESEGYGKVQLIIGTYNGNETLTSKAGGKLYIEKKNGIITASFCDVVVNNSTFGDITISGSLKRAY